VISPASWDSLHRHLGHARVEEDPPAAARVIAPGWVESLGPACESGDPAHVMTTPAEHGFRETS
jgi:hypothetical protein